MTPNQHLQNSLNLLLPTDLLTVDGIIGNKTRAKVEKLWSETKAVFQRKGYKLDKSNCELIGIRLDDVFDNEFSDICLIVIDSNVYAYPMSSLAGLYGSGNVFNPNWIDGVFGVGVVKEGQYERVYQLNTGWWTGLPFLMQVAPMDYYRDGNKDTKLDRGTVYSGLKGFNFHSWRGFLGNVVNNLSQGCQVFPEPTYQAILPLLSILSQRQTFITYTLLHKDDFNL